MNTQEPVTKLQVGDQFSMGRITCTITKVTSFSGEPHYGFTFMHDTAPGEPYRFGCGYMPVYFVENFTGYFPKEVA